MRARNVDKMDAIGASDPFLVIHRISATGKPVEIYKSEVIDDNLNPEWNSFTLPVKDITGGGDINGSLLLIECWDEDNLGKDLIGKAQVHLCCVDS